MTASIDYIKERFDYFNRLIFAGRLPAVRIALTDASSFLGKCVSKMRRLPDGTAEHYDIEIRISTRHDLPPEVIDDTVIHEMIHYFIVVNGLKDTSSHGDIFKAIMRSINAAHGRHITISHRQRDVAGAAQPPTDSRRKWHAIAVITFHDGHTGVKVLPRIAERIRSYYLQVRRSAGVCGVDLYLHDNPFFNRYPTSSALRYHELDAETIRQQLVGAKPLSDI